MVLDDFIAECIFSFIRIAPDLLDLLLIWHIKNKPHRLSTHKIAKLLVVNGADKAIKIYFYFATVADINHLKYMHMQLSAELDVVSTEWGNLNGFNTSIVSLRLLS